jgi:hypothetical protein
LGSGDRGGWVDGGGFEGGVEDEGVHCFVGRDCHGDEVSETVAKCGQVDRWSSSR